MQHLPTGVLPFLLSVVVALAPFGSLFPALRNRKFQISMSSAIANYRFWRIHCHFADRYVCRNQLAMLATFLTSVLCSKIQNIPLKF